MDVGNLISGSSTFFNSSLYTWKFLVHILLKPILEAYLGGFLSMTLLACGVGEYPWESLGLQGDQTSQS